MCHRSGFRNCNDVTAADGPGQCNSGGGASMCFGNTAKNGITQQAGAEAAKRRIGHYRYAVPFAPWQQVTFNAAVAEVVKDLIGRAAIPKWNMEQILHLGDCEVGHAPGTNLVSCTETFEPRYDLGKFGVRSWPVQQIKIEMINTEPGKARLASTSHGVAGDVICFHFKYYIGTLTLAGNHALNQFFGTALTTIPRCVNERHPQRKARPQRFFFVSCGMSSLPDMPRALTDRRDDG